MILYVVSYFLLLNPIICVNEGHLGIVVDGYREADYYVGGEVSQTVFSPIHHIDRKIRPNYWDHYSDSLEPSPESEFVGPQKTPFD